MQKKNFGPHSSLSPDWICRSVRNFWALFLLFTLIIVVVTTAGCQTMPPDVPVCVEFSPIHARCVKIISGEKFNVNDKEPLNGETWWEIRHRMILMPAKSWAELKAYIIKSCKKYGNCQAEVASWDRTLEIIDDQLEEKEAE